MTAMARGKKGLLSIYVNARNGALVQRSTGSASPVVARAMKRMVNQFRDEHRWSILDALTAKTKRGEKPTLTLAEAYTYFASNKVAELEARLAAHNLSESLPGWIQWVRATRRKTVRTADVYWQQVTTLIKDDEVFLTSDLTKPRVIAWLTGRDLASSGTKRKYLYALKSFIRYLMDTGVLDLDPLAGLRAPKKNPPRERWETAEVDERIVANALPQYQAYFAFIKGTGCDVGAALRATVGDVNLFASKANLRGTKTDTRRRVHQAAIEAWALPYIKAQVAARRAEGTSALLFPDLNRNAPTKHHEHLCRVLNIADYTLKDSRHSVGVRMRLAKESFEAISDQLGTSVFQAVTVYTKYKRDDDAKQAEAK